MSSKLIAYCGLDCATCPAFIATQENDLLKLTSLASEWFDGSTDHAIILCDGCKPNRPDARIMKWCSECPVRICVMERNLDSCAFCSDYPCERLNNVFENAEQAKTTLDQLRLSWDSR